MHQLNFLSRRILLYLTISPKMSASKQFSALTSTVLLVLIFALLNNQHRSDALDASGSAQTDNKVDAASGVAVTIIPDVNEETAAPCTCLQQLVQQRKIKAQRQRYLKCLEVAEAKRWSPQSWMDPAALVDCSRLNPDERSDETSQFQQQAFQPCVCTLKSIEAQKRIQRLENYRKCDKVRTYVSNMPMNGVFWNVHNCEQHLEPGDVEFLSADEAQSLKRTDLKLNDQAAKRRFSRFAKQFN